MDGLLGRIVFSLTPYLKSIQLSAGVFFKLYEQKKINSANSGIHVTTIL